MLEVINKLGGDGSDMIKWVTSFVTLGDVCVHNIINEKNL